jgi:hypothetical protein
LGCGYKPNLTNSEDATQKSSFKASICELFEISTGKLPRIMAVKKENPPVSYSTLIHVAMALMPNNVIITLSLSARNPQKT